MPEESGSFWILRAFWDGKTLVLFLWPDKWSAGWKVLQRCARTWKQPDLLLCVILLVCVTTHTLVTVWQWDIAWEGKTSLAHSHTRSIAENRSTVKSGWEAMKWRVSPSLSRDYARSPVAMRGDFSFPMLCVCYPQPASHVVLCGLSVTFCEATSSDRCWTQGILLRSLVQCSNTYHPFWGDGSVTTVNITSQEVVGEGWR